MGTDGDHSHHRTRREGHGIGEEVAFVQQAHQARTHGTRQGNIAAGEVGTWIAAKHGGAQQRVLPMRKPGQASERLVLLCRPVERVRLFGLDQDGRDAVPASFGLQGPH